MGALARPVLRGSRFLCGGAAPSRIGGSAALLQRRARHPAGAGLEAASSLPARAPGPHPARIRQGFSQHRGQRSLLELCRGKVHSLLPRDHSLGDPVWPTPRNPERALGPDGELHGRELSAGPDRGRVAQRHRFQRVQLYRPQVSDLPHRPLLLQGPALDGHGRQRRQRQLCAYRFHTPDSDQIPAERGPPGPQLQGEGPGHDVLLPRRRAGNGAAVLRMGLWCGGRYLGKFSGAHVRWPLAAQRGGLRQLRRYPDEPDHGFSGVLAQQRLARRSALRHAGTQDHPDLHNR